MDCYIVMTHIASEVLFSTGAVYIVIKLFYYEIWTEFLC